MFEEFERWIGNQHRKSYSLDPWPAQALAAALGNSSAKLDTGDPLPPFWHHLYGHEPIDAGETGSDGHPKRGGFLPPVPLQRRMWAGGRLWFDGELQLGQTLQRRSTVKNVTAKDGRNGPLVFVLVEHLMETSSGQVREEHDIVYLNPSKSAKRDQAVAEDAAWRKLWLPDEVLLFRYSALTYNGHRIHYDHRYVTEVEGYPGLIVHGPLLATLLLELLRDHAPNRRLASFAFRALAPRFAGETLVAAAKPNDDSENSVDLWIAGPTGELSMRADAIFAS